MDLFIDGIPFHVRHGECLSKEEILEVVMEELIARGQVLKEIVCHGEAMSEEAFLSIFDEVDVDFISGDRSELLDEIMAEIGESAALALSKIGGDQNEEWSDQVEWICKALNELDPFVEDLDLASISQSIENSSDDPRAVRTLLEHLKARFLKDDEAFSPSDSNGINPEEKGD